MTDTEKVKINPLHDGEDFCLWKIRVDAAVDAKGYGTAMMMKEP